MSVMGVPPSVSSATNALMTIMMSSSIAMLFVTAGLMPRLGLFRGHLIFMLATITFATLGYIASSLILLSGAD
eukprot:Nitzschia sp. Nitz4//scaffold30_size153850//136023//136299//NITZ4_002797-RA/size153850-snap-gene-0.91-mRNA-1//1//CDS//3329547321//616//frame0